MLSVVTGAGGGVAAVAVDMRFITATLARRTIALTFTHKLSVTNPWLVMLMLLIRHC